MATPTGIAAVARQAASGYAQRVLPRQRTYTTYWDINALLSSLHRSASLKETGKGTQASLTRCWRMQLVRTRGLQTTGTSPGPPGEATRLQVSARHHAIKPNPSGKARPIALRARFRLGRTARSHPYRGRAQPSQRHLSANGARGAARTVGNQSGHVLETRCPRRVHSHSSNDRHHSLRSG